MARQIRKGDHVLIEAKISRVWGDGLVSMYLPGVETPVTLHEDDIREVIPQAKEKPVGGRRKFYDVPDE